MNEIINIREAFRQDGTLSKFILHDADKEAILQMTGAEGYDPTKVEFEVLLNGVKVKNGDLVDFINRLSHTWAERKCKSMGYDAFAEHTEGLNAELVRLEEDRWMSVSRAMFRQTGVESLTKKFEDHLANVMGVFSEIQSSARFVAERMYDEAESKTYLRKLRDRLSEGPMSEADQQALVQELNAMEL